MDSNGSSSLEKAKAAIEKFEESIGSDELLDESDLSEIHCFRAVMHSLFSIAERLEALSMRSFKI